MKMAQESPSPSEAANPFQDLVAVGVGYGHVSAPLKAAWDWLTSIFTGERIPQCSFIQGTAEVGENSYRERYSRHTGRPLSIKFGTKRVSQIRGIAVTPLDEKTPSPDVEVIAGGVNYDSVHLQLVPLSKGPWGCHVDICFV